MDYSKRYWVFSWADYEAQGGLNDLVGTFENFEEALVSARKELSSSPNVLDAEIFDSVNKKVVWKDGEMCVPIIEGERIAG